MFDLSAILFFFKLLLNFLKFFVRTIRNYIYTKITFVIRWGRSLKAAAANGMEMWKKT